MIIHPQRHLVDLLKDFSTAMMLTRSGDKSMHARPMSIAEINEEGELFFAASLDSGKLRDIEFDPEVTLTLQGDSVYISLQGTAHVSTDSELIERLWSEDWRVWFPEGKEDPMLVILRIVPLDAEYWDVSGTEGIAYAMTALKAYIKGNRPPEADGAQHAKVAM